MRVLLINPPGWQSGSVSLGLGYLAAVLRRDGHEVKVLDETGQKLDPLALAEKAKDFAPAVIGFHCKTAQANAVALISRKIKDIHPSATHVVGGPHITLCHQEFLTENTDFAFGFLGEAEEAFSEFCKKFAAQEPLTDIPGLAYRRDGGIQVNPRKPIGALDKLPRPDFDAIEGFSWRDFRYPLLTSRGCPYKCNFCSVPLTAGPGFRTRTPDDCVDELAAAKRDKGIACFEILDDNFTLNLTRAKAFCRALIQKGLGLSWYCHNGIRADRLDAELAGLMKKAGCTSIAFGVESGDPEVFQRIGKGETLEQISQAIRITKDAGMQAVGYFIIGLPGDSLAAVRKTIAFQRTLRLDHFTYGIFIPYPGTVGRDEVLKEGRIIRDLKETSHFSDRPQIAIEYPYFSRAEIEEAYYLAAAGELGQLLEDHGVQRGAELLFVETDPPTYGHRQIARWTHGSLDLFINAAYDGNFEEDRRSGAVRAIYSYERSFSRWELAVQMVRRFRELRRKRYELALWPIRWRHSGLLVGGAFTAFILIARPRRAVLYDFGTSRFIVVSWRNPGFRNRVFKLLIKKILGPSAAEHPVQAVLILPWRLLRLLARIGMFALGEAFSRALYASLLVYLLAWGRPGAASAAPGPVPDQGPR
ncbi:MAG: radical SAM protein [Elusimicrobia bacterium]|nr:radical SAM protein [Elusimicrobiota bacterium]